MKNNTEIEVDFFEKYKTIENPFRNNAGYDNCMFETYDEEYNFVKEISESNPRKVWTLIDNNDGWFGVISGFHWVNRIGFFITEQDCIEEYEEYVL